MLSLTLDSSNREIYLIDTQSSDTPHRIFVTDVNPYRVSYRVFQANTPIMDDKNVDLFRSRDGFTMNGHEVTFGFRIGERGKFRIWFDAPNEVRILRNEVYMKLKKTGEL